MGHSASVSSLLWVVVPVLLWSCGGTVIPADEDAGTAGGDTGGAGGTLATGGTGGGVAGTGGGVAGTGGYATGGIGGAATGGIGGATTGGAGGSPACPPLPSCNWCGGAPRYDAIGCVVGFVCANGADPCSTQPCMSDSDCNGGYCKDSLCWGGAVSCTSPECVGSGGGGYATCSCSWSCTDGNSYAFDCTAQGGSLSCTCYENGSSNVGCGTAGGAGGAPNVCESCCGFPQ